LRDSVAKKRVEMELLGGPMWGWGEEWALGMVRGMDSGGVEGTGMEEGWVVWGRLEMA